MSNSQISDELKTILDYDVDRIVLDEVAHYRQYCQEQQIENGAQTIQHLFPESSESEHLLYEVSEADLFLQNQPDDFPNNFVQDLVGRILECLSRYSILTVTFDSSFSPRARLGRSYQIEDVQASYKYCLFRAWLVATALGIIAKRLLTERVGAEQFLNPSLPLLHSVRVTPSYVYTLAIVGLCPLKKIRTSAKSIPMRLFSFHKLCSLRLLYMRVRG